MNTIDVLNMDEFDLLAIYTYLNIDLILKIIYAMLTGF